MQKQNKDYGYIQTIIYVISRNIFGYLMKNKTLEDTTNELKSLFKNQMLKGTNQNISVFMSDSDSSVLSGSNQGDERDFNKRIDLNESILDPIKKQDLYALTIIDRFAFWLFQLNLFKGREHLLDSYLE